jgi:AraC-like DNA-binding protein
VAEFFRLTVFFGGAFTLVLTLGALARPGRNLANHCVALLALSSAVLYFYLYIMLEGIVLSPPFANHLYVPFVYVLGPAMYVMFMATLQEEYVLRFNRLLFLPSVLLLAGIPALHYLDPGLFAAYPLEYFRSDFTGLAEILLIAGFGINGVYYFIILIRCLPVFRPDSLRREPGARVMLYILAGSGAVTSYLISAYVFRSLDTLLYGAVATTLFTIITHIAAQRVPGVFKHIGPAIREAYSNSRLAAVDVNQVDALLNRLMGQEKIYRDEELSLASLAEMLEIRPDQLSEYLNSRRGQNFSRFVNTYRVEEAAQILLREEKANVLSVAFQVGFNSKATFNSAFKAVLKDSPREFLRKAREVRGEKRAGQRKAGKRQ